MIYLDSISKDTRNAKLPSPLKENVPQNKKEFNSSLAVAEVLKITRIYWSKTNESNYQKEKQYAEQQKTQDIYVA